MSEEHKLEDIMDKVLDFVRSQLAETDKADLMIYLGLSYLSYDKLKSVLGDLPAALYGPIALKLATTPTYGGGLELKVLGTGTTIPVNSQVAGCTMLAILGVAYLPWEALKDQVKKNVETANAARAIIISKDEFLAGDLVQYMNQNERAELDKRIGLAAWTSRDYYIGGGTKVAMEDAALSLQTYINNMKTVLAERKTGGTSGGGAR